MLPVGSAAARFIADLLVRSALLFGLHKDEISDSQVMGKNFISLYFMQGLNRGMGYA